MAATRAAPGHIDDDLYIEDRDDLADGDALDEPFASVQVRAEQTESRVVCRAEWGGWSWRAEAPDRSTAQDRLNRRLARLDPFELSEEGWGPPGHQVGELDAAIPPTMRQRMRDYTQREARSAVGLLEAVFEAQARRPWAFPDHDAPVPNGIEVEGYVAGDGSLVLFPRTFYDIANAYFGRVLPNGAAHRNGNGGGGSEAGADQPGFAGALRRLSEHGYMRSAEGGLAHQIRPIEVYVFTPRPDAAAAGRPR